MLFAACEEQDGFQIQGSGNVVSQKRDVDSFRSIHLASVIDANISRGDREVTIVADHNIMGLIKSEVRNGVLYIFLKDGNYDNVSVTANISVEHLDDLTTVGVNEVSLNNLEQTDRLELNIEGVGNIKMNGTARELVVNSSGSSNLEAFDLLSQDCEIHLTGVGNVQISVSNKLTGDLSGVGNILYKGTPVVDVKVTGVGNVVNAN